MQTTKAKLLVTRKWPDSIEQELNTRYDVTLNHDDIALTAEQLILALQNYDAILPTVTDTLSADIINSPNKRCKMIANFGVGFNHIDIKAAEQNNIVVTNTPDVLTDCTADIAILLLLMSARRAAEGEQLIRNQQWQGWCPTQLTGQKVTGKTLGLIGFGRIAQAVARKAHYGFGMKIICYNPSTPDPEIISQFSAEACNSVEQVLETADFVSLHCPGGASTKHLINEQRLNIMRPDAHLINTARGDVVDSAALIKALSSGWIAGAGLDVFENEPDIHPGLLQLPNVAMLPHLGSATNETRRAMGQRVLDNVNAFFSGRTPQDRIV